MKDDVFDATTNEIKPNKEFYNSENANIKDILKLLRTENRVKNYKAILLPVLSTCRWKIVLFHGCRYNLSKTGQKVTTHQDFCRRAKIEYFYSVLIKQENLVSLKRQKSSTKNDCL